MIMIDCDFPGGNIIAERIDGDDVFVRQDLRDTDRDWFYWYFRVRGAAGRTVRFHFTGSNVIGTRGPGMSEDGGVTWRWLGNDAVDGQSFVYAFANDADEVRFSFGMPYVQADLDRFLASYVDSDYLVGSESEAQWQEQIRFSHILEAERTGGLPFCAADNLPFGVE
ncbi:MAG: hypothetical protein OXN20_00240 [Gemmatimonadota bacterium]|nr:hypothetical protein [Gemmatimonadota bacterium]